MLLSLSLPAINVHMTAATIMRVYARAGDALAPGAKLMDVRVDLSDVFPQDCPPISYYRLVLRERAWVRRVGVTEGAEVATGGMLALLSTEPDEELTPTPARAARLATAGILWQPQWAEAGAR